MDNSSSEQGETWISTRFDLGKIFQLIIKRLKTDCQWRELSIKVYFSNQGISWQLIYYYFKKWSKDGSFKRIWIFLLK
ncbi:transposase [Chryseobacterium cucumeris]|uniref:transposase n=1 Tax=Chryseobacterium TaxID=59732 RepID=UPI0028830BEA|nr:transposase [Chryseobacterium sp. SG20098]WNI36431.1 transposase [Chryseobacterium sp. SG20098]